MSKTASMETPYRAAHGMRIEYGPMVAGDGFLVATVSRDQPSPRERREFIVRACNSHDALVEACEKLANIAEMVGHCVGTWSGEHIALAQRVAGESREVLADARKGD